MFSDRYNLTREQNIFLAKKLIAENIYHSARLEGCNVTFPDTKTILDGVSVANLKMDEVECILNLRDAWKYLVANIEKPFDLEFICKINGLVARNESLEWGVLRTGTVGIGGTTAYQPAVPVKERVIEEMAELLKLNSVTERAIRFFLWACRSQLFWDGNKRTATLGANKILIFEGKGILSVKADFLAEFNRRLTEFYDSNDYSRIDSFIYENCLFGIEF
jgi:Fic family protein